MASPSCGCSSDGIQGAVVASPSLAATLQSQDGLPVLANLADQHFASGHDAYAWALTNVWPQTTHRMLTAVARTPSSLLRDARFDGSMGGRRLNALVVGMAGIG